MRPTGEVKYYGIQPRRTHLLLEKTGPNLKQVVSVYAWFYAELASFISAKLLESWWMAIPGFLLLGLPWVLRRGASERMKAESARQAIGFAPELSE
jgi:hypothetical protein